MNVMQTLKVLVLEDHAFQRALAVTALKQAGVHHIIEAADGTEALKKLTQSGGADVAICDLHMPGIDGPHFMRQAFQLDLVKGIIISSEAEQTLRSSVVSMIDFLGLNFLGDLGKPLPVEKLRALLLKYKHSERSQQTPLPELHELPSPDEVLAALKNNEFKAYYQPKMNICTSTSHGAEVLARWHHPQRGVLTPLQFMPVIEAYELLDQLFTQLLKQGCEMQRQLLSQGKQLELAYNLAPSQLCSRTLVDEIRSTLAHYQLPASGLMLEVTESGLLSAPATSYENLVRLRLLGCGLAMDDFGAGYSSLRRLCDLPFNQIKLDASFLLGLNKQPRSRAIIKSAITLAKELSMSLVIEGVETEGQQAEIKQMGCTLAQGFIYARPMPIDQFFSFLNVHILNTPIAVRHR
jgi:EAL domain-containing protein (putative c-di-GMP-specific phosphodiesterase class I)/CheY-like chemotaxis protein